MVRKIIIVAVWCLTIQGLYAQERKGTTGAGCEDKDLVDWIRQWFHLHKKEKTSNSAFFIAPVFGSTPSNGFIIGATFQSAFKLTGSNLSAFQANIQFTSKKQLLIFLRNTIYAKENKLLLSGDWRYFAYSEPTYGLGTAAPEGGTLQSYFHWMGQGESTDSLAQPMKFNYFKFHQLASVRMAPGLYLGGGIHFDMFSSIKDERLDTPLTYITSHYAYSKLHDFDPEKYKEIGLSVNLVYDTRDNQINAYKGMYANLNYRVNPEFLGSDAGSSVLYTEFRYFKGLSKKSERLVLAFWYVGQFTTSGTQPYLALPALGYDQRSKTGRGYAIGRYRGQSLLYAETELRFPISKCTNTLGGVVFANVTSTNNRDSGIKMLQYVQPGVGLGLRILFNKTTRMNMQVDYGKGNGSGGIYFGASEVF